jgi:hypothetical protein
VIRDLKRPGEYKEVEKVEDKRKRNERQVIRQIEGTGG